MKYTLLTAVLAFLPSLVLAADTIPSLLNRGTGFIGNILIYFLMAVALFSFVFNVSRYFIFGGGDEAGREKAKRYALYSILALVFIIIMWTIVNVLVASLGFGRAAELRPDYLK
jgi:hypothetical protein